MLHKFIWRINYTIYPYLRDLILFTKVWRHTGRQNFRIGFVKKGVKKSDIKRILKFNGFEKSVCSWIDDGEVLSMRKCVGGYQYHIRFFSDGEIRGHYECSPEGAPVRHLLAKFMRSGRQYFRKILWKVLI